MKNLLLLPLVALAFAFAGSMSAAMSPLAGAEAPSIGSCNWVVNAPAEDDISNLLGEVIMVEAWGVNCPPCRRLIPHLNSLHKEYGDKGLHIFAFHRQGGTDEALTTFCNNNGIVYPVASSGAGSYNTGGGIPKCWIIGVEGKVVYAGHPGSADSYIKDELAKVKYLGLGKADIHEELDGAAKAYVEGDLEKAREEALEVKADEADDEQAVSDADFILEKVKTSYDNMLRIAEDAEGSENYLKAQRAYEQIEEAFGKAEEAEKAEAKLDGFKDDKVIRDEIKAAESLEKIAEKLEGKDAEDITKNLDRFLASSKYEGTFAAKLAEEAKGESDPIAHILKSLK